METSEVRYEKVPWLQSSSTTEQNSTSDKKNTLDKDAFLKLLVTELKYQNPLEPMQDKEFISQMANFTSLEQMKNLNTGFEKLSESLTGNMLPGMQMQQATSMIGRNVSYLNKEGQIESGTVDSVIINQGVPYCVIGEKAISTSNILAVKDASSTNESILKEILDQLKILSEKLTPEAGESI